jgi:hypothetical protein
LPTFPGHVGTLRFGMLILLALDLGILRRTRSDMTGGPGQRHTRRGSTPHLAACGCRHLARYLACVAQVIPAQFAVATARFAVHRLDAFCFCHSCGMSKPPPISLTIGTQPPRRCFSSERFRGEYAWSEPNLPSSVSCDTWWTDSAISSLQHHPPTTFPHISMSLS